MAKALERGVHEAGVAEVDQAHPTVEPMGTQVRQASQPRHSKQSPVDRLHSLPGWRRRRRLQLCASILVVLPFAPRGGLQLQDGVLPREPVALQPCEPMVRREQCKGYHSAARSHDPDDSGLRGTALLVIGQSSGALCEIALCEIAVAICIREGTASGKHHHLQCFERAETVT